MRRMRTFPAIPQSVHAARRFATDTLADSPEQALEAVELMVSELATNCIRHERASFHVAILRRSDEIRVEVTDSGGGMPTMRSPGPDEPSGRGLQIVDMLSERWGVEPESPSGKTVWFTLDVSASPGREAESAGAWRAEGGRPAAGSRRPESVQQHRSGTRGPTSQQLPGCQAGRARTAVRSRSPAAQDRRRARRYSGHDEPDLDARRRRSSDASGALG
jgi:anti-sigma regulatory factor (Ser/Thr protein kinase)